MYVKLYCTEYHALALLRYGGDDDEDAMLAKAMSESMALAGQQQYTDFGALPTQHQNRGGLLNAELDRLRETLGYDLTPEQFEEQQLACVLAATSP